VSIVTLGRLFSNLKSASSKALMIAIQVQTQTMRKRIVISS